MSIADELALLANTKENLRLSLGLRKDVPFSQYASRIPFYAKAGTVFDFVNNQYSKDQLPVNLSDISEFIRLSSATMWHDGQLVEVANNVPRISGEGLLIEEQRTNDVIWSQDLTQWRQTNRLTTSLESDPRFGQVTRLTNTGDTPGRPLGSGAYVETFGRAQVTIVCKPEPECVLIGHARLDRATIRVFSVDFDSLIFRNLLEDSFGSLTGTVKDIGGGYYKIEIDWVNRNASEYYRHLGLLLGETSSDLLVAYVQLAQGALPTSYIPTEGSAVTRAPEILNIPVKPTQVVKGDWDDGVTYEIADNVASFTGHGYIRNITVEEL